MMNAVHDTLAAAGVKYLDMPASPHRLWQAIQGRRSACGDTIMYAFEFTRAKTGRRRRNGARQVRRQGAGRRSEPRRRDEAAARATGHARRPSGIAELKGIRKDGDAIVIGAMTRHAEVAASDVVKARDSGARRARRRHRRPAGAQHGHARRLARQQRSGRRLAGRGRWAQRDACITNKRKIAADDFFKGMYETALAADEIITAVSFPIPKKAAYVKFPNPASRFALVGVFVAQTAERRARRGHRRGVSVFRAEALEDALAKSFTADAAKAVKIDAQGLNDDLHALARVSRAPDSRHGRASRRRRAADRPPVCYAVDWRPRAPRRSFRALRARDATTPAAPASVDASSTLLDRQNYVADRRLATSVFLALKLGRPLFLEGEAGVGKTEIAKVLAAALGKQLVRLQCYEGLDTAAAVYEWNYPRQMIEIRLAEAAGGVDRDAARARHLHDAVPAEAAAAAGARARRRRRAGAADRRARSRRRAVRGVPARSALRLPGDDSRARRDPRGRRRRSS